jgi:hypothetical protein
MPAPSSGGQAYFTVDRVRLPTVDGTSVTATVDGTNSMKGHASHRGVARIPLFDVSCGNPR